MDTEATSQDTGGGGGGPSINTTRLLAEGAVTNDDSRPLPHNTSLALTSCTQPSSTDPEAASGGDGTSMVASTSEEGAIKNNDTHPLHQESHLLLASSEGAGVRLCKTFELLEQILLYRQSTVDLTRWQRVSRQWRDVMANSKLLQQKLFLSPAPVCLILLWRLEGVSQDLTLNVNMPFFTSEPRQNGKLKAAVASLHPALHMTDDEFKKGIKITFDAKHFLSYRASDRAWRNTFLTQPPTSEVVLSSQFGTDHFGDWALCNGTFKDPKGVRLGAIMDKIEADIDWLETVSAYALPPHAHVSGDADALATRLHRKYRENLQFYFLECTAKGVISDVSAWVYRANLWEEAKKAAAEAKAEEMRKREAEDMWTADVLESLFLL